MNKYADPLFGNLTQVYKMIRTMYFLLMIDMRFGLMNLKILTTLGCFGILLSTRFDKIQFLIANSKQGKERPKWQKKVEKPSGTMRSGPVTRKC